MSLAYHGRACEIADIRPALCSNPQIPPVAGAAGDRGDAEYATSSAEYGVEGWSREIFLAALFLFPLDHTSCHRAGSIAILQKCQNTMSTVASRNDMDTVLEIEGFVF